MKFCISSDWARWDIHIHAPGTAINDNYKNNWEEYLNKIKTAVPKVVALGITDYCSINCYEEFLKHFDPSKIESIKYIFPNIEFRLFPQTAKGHPLNLHILVSSHPKDHIDRCKEALSHLTTILGDDTIACDHNGMVRLGRIHEKQNMHPTTDEEALYKIGVSQFKVDPSKFFDWYASEKWLKKYSLLAIAGGNDGLAGIRSDSGFKQIHDNLVKNTHLIFSSQTTDIAYFSGKGPDDKKAIESIYGNLKACIHGSDAHDIQRVLEPDEKKYCWIKAYPCFDGLRQVLLEPSDRVYIGTEPPGHSDSDTVIECISIRNHKDWFITTDLSFSPFLNAIIGEKGTGKTALIDLIAYNTGSWQKKENSFLHKAWKELLGAEITIKWVSGKESTVIIGESDESLFPKTRYLSQQFVERLCSGDIMATELLKEVENVVFDYLPEADRMNCSDFQELRNKLTESFTSERSEIQQNIVEINKQIEIYNNSIRNLPEKKASLDKKKSEIDFLEKQVKSLLEGTTPVAIEFVSKLKSKLFELHTEAAEINNKILLIDNLDTKIERYEKHFEEINLSILEELDKIGIPKNTWINFHPVFRGDVQTPLKSAKEKLKLEIDKLMGKPDDKPSDNTIIAIEKLIKVEETKLKLDNTRKKKIKDIQDKITLLSGEIKKLENEIEKTVKIKDTLLIQINKKRMLTYLKYFKILSEERKTLEKLYHPTNTYRDSEIHLKNPLEFEVITVVDIKTWAERGENMLDLRRSGQLSSHGALLEFVKDKLESAWEHSEIDKIEKGIEDLLNIISKGGLGTKLRTGFSPRDIADWIFSVDHISLEYSLKYEGIPLRFLSPGTRGILLLILYLSLDKYDDRPLLIDQPEENLDNASVYDVLVEYFRAAKKRRQIFIVSHNPNLVVNTDSEQIIVASSKRRPNDLPSIHYNSGPLEVLPNREIQIRELICNILEGGERAFLKREERYSIGHIK